MPFVNRCGDAPKLQTKTVTPTTNQQIITPDTGYEGLEKVVVNAPVFQSKTITVDGTVTADNGYSGLSSVTVNVPYDVYYTTVNISDAHSPQSISFDMGDVMGLHNAKPSKIILYNIVKSKKTSWLDEGTTSYINGACLYKHSETQYLGNVYINGGNSYLDNKIYHFCHGHRVYISESDIQYPIPTSLDGKTRDCSIKIAYNNELNKMIINASDCLFYWKDSKYDTQKLRFMGSGINGDNYDNDYSSYGAYFIWI